MTAGQLIDLLKAFPSDWVVYVGPTHGDRLQEIEEVKEMTAPRFDQYGNEVGEYGIGEIEILTSKIVTF